MQANKKNKCQLIQTTRFSIRLKPSDLLILAKQTSGVIFSEIDSSFLDPEKLLKMARIKGIEFLSNFYPMPYSNWTKLVALS